MPIQMQENVMIIGGLLLFAAVTGAQVLLARTVADKLTVLAHDTH
jgi:hypothetical protein